LPSTERSAEPSGGALSPPLSRATWLTAALGWIAVGLGLHRFGFGLSPRLRDATGDALWAAMMFAWVGVLVPRQRIRVRGPVAVGICWAVEFSQMYHTPMLDAWRDTTLGSLVLGTDFDARDLVAYTIGVLIAASLEIAMRRRPRPS
jgi:hypothetical protein